VLTLEFFEQIRAPLYYASWRAWLLLAKLRDRLRPALAMTRAFVRDLRALLSGALFELCIAFFAVGDRLAGLRDRVPARSDMQPSTLIAYGAVGVMAAFLVNDLLGPTPAASSAAAIPEQRPDWIEIARPHGAFALQSPTLDGLEARFAMRRHRDGGGRKEEFTFGDPVGHGAYARLSVYRPGSEGMADPDPLAAVVAVASESTIDAELQETDRKLRTKFGALPIVAMSVKGHDGMRRCIATAAGWSDPPLGIVAWWCNDGPELVAHGEFACLLDRLALMSAGGDDRLAEFFARAELKRGSCASQSSFVSPTPKRPDDWIHAKIGPRLRGRLSPR
jgi:hypothetical protein